MAPHILVVDDEAPIRALVREHLEANGMRVSEAASGREMQRALAASGVDLVVLDLQLPDADGLAIARDLRASQDLPIIMLTGRRSESDRVLGLDLGADDYVTKPFSQRELLARVRAVLRRTESQRKGRGTDRARGYRFSGWELRTGTRKLTNPRGEPVEITNAEYALLVAFLRSPRKVLPRDRLLEASRLHDDIHDRSIDVQILRLRRKVEEKANEPRLIRTERGAGYYLDAEVETL